MMKAFGARRGVLLGCSLVVATLLGAGTPVLAQTTRAATPSAEDKASSPPPVASTSPAFSHLFTDTIRDFRRLPSRDTLTWLSIGGAVTFAGHSRDSSVTRSLSRSHLLGETLEPGKAIGSFPFQLGGAFAAYGLGRLTDSPRVTAVGADLVRAQLLAQGITFAVKRSVRRTRPDGTSFSFPSGHASLTFASATVLQKHFGWKVGVPAYGIASYVAASRIQMKRHYLSDVTFGATLGIIVGRTVTIGRGNARVAVTPMVAPGPGVAFTWIGAH